jgi:26S proteasome regulatory subunit N3
VAARHAAAFAADGTRHLVGRLRANVIRAGLRRISLAYSRISLADVAAKLGLPSEEDAQHVVAKAIRDGGVAASLDHDARVMLSAAPADVYATEEPQAAFHARIAFCMDVHNEALRAMRFDAAGGAQREWDDANALRERQEQGLQAALEEDDMDF